MTRSKVFPVTNNYKLSLAEMISAGHYDRVNDDITAEHFPIRGGGTAELEAQLVHLNRLMESEDVLKELDKNDLWPGTIPELLAFGAKHPELQRQFPIIPLGSVWQDHDGRPRVPSLSSGPGKRVLFLNSGSEFHDGCRFLAIRK